MRNFRGIKKNYRYKVKKKLKRVNFLEKLSKKVREKKIMGSENMQKEEVKFLEKVNNLYEK